MIGHQGAIWIPNNNYTKGWRRGKPHYIIIHGTASGTSYQAQATGRDFQSMGISTHYIVGYDGAIVQTVSEENSAWGNGVISGPAGVAKQGDPNAPHDAFWDSTGGEPNGDTISIETARSSDNTSPWSQVQTMALYSLVAGIIQRWGIPAQMADQNGGITGHFSIDPVHRAFCPGPVDWEALISAAGGSGVYSPGQQFPYSPGGQYSQSPSTTWANAPVAIGGWNTVFLKTSENVHQTLAHAPGFYGVCLALDEAEQYPGIYNAFSGDSNPSNYPSDAVMSVMGSISGNGGAFLLRAGLVALGLLLLVGLFWHASEPARLFMGSVAV